MLQFAKLLPYCLAVALQVTASLAQESEGNLNVRVFAPLTRPDKVSTIIPIRDNTYGVRNVSYYTTDDGLAIIDGDVIYGTVDQLRAHDIRGDTNNTKEFLEPRAFTVTSNSGRTWPGANVRYKYDSAAMETLLAPIVNAAISRWRAGTPWLTFTKLASSAVEEKGVAMIRATPCGGCNSYIGWAANAPRSLKMNLQQRGCTTSPGVCGVNEAVHEFGHLLGFYHEHQRPDREANVHYNCANLRPSCPAGIIIPPPKTCCNSGIPAGCCGAAGNFAITTSGSIDASGPYDPTSVMQYRADAFAIPGTNTLTPAAPGIVIPTVNPGMPSPRDSKRLCKLYKTVCPAAKTCTVNGCPAGCSFIRTCHDPVLCTGEFAPTCCKPSDANAACQAKKTRCTNLGCDFLTQ